MVNNKNIDAVINLLKKKIPEYKVPIVGIVANETHDPFKVLISCLISLRTKDKVTELATERLFNLGKEPEDFAVMTEKKIQKAIYPAGFYRVKAKTIISVSKDLIQRYNSKVPDSINELLTLKGVGRKTANLVVILGFNKYGICVDTHVHRITNLWGYVKTKNPEETEFALREKLPRKHWKIINDLLVTYGQNLCVPVSPFCSRCVIEKYCVKTNLKRRR